MYNFDEIINRRGTQSVKWDRYEEDLLPMWIADMDFRSPPAVLKALAERAEHGVFGYGLAGDMPGIICQWMREEFKVSLEEEWIVLLPAIVPVLRAVSHLREGPVLINTPNYNALLDAPLKAGKETVLVPLNRTIENTDEKYTMGFDEMEKALAAAQGKSKLFFFCNPHNPVGRVYTREELLELSSFAKKNNLIVVSDEVHCGLVFDRPHIPWFSLDDYAAEQSITIIGPAKTYNLPGLPFGFAIIPNKSLREDFNNLCFAMPGPAVFSVVAARTAFTECRDWKKALVEYLRGNRDYLEGRLRKDFPAAAFPRTEGTYLQWIDLRPLGIKEPHQWLREKCKIQVSEGKIYGEDGYIRLNFGCPRSVLKEALDRMAEGGQ